MARNSRRRGKSKRKQSEVFTRIGAAWENETKSGDALIGLRLDIEDLLDYLDEIKFDDLPDEGTKIAVVLLENTKYPGKGKPDFVAYGTDPVLDKEDEKPNRRKKRRRDEEDEKPKRKKRSRKSKDADDDDDLDLDLD